MFPVDWNERIASLPRPHILQTEEWGKVKSAYGWQTIPQEWMKVGDGQAAALVLERILPVPGLSSRFRILYVPRGPLLDWSNSAARKSVLKNLQDLAHERKAIFIKIDPEVILGRGVPGQPGSLEEPAGQAYLEDLRNSGWQYSSSQVQFKNTVIINIQAADDELLQRMKQKTRYNVRLAQRKGVTVRTGSLADLPLLYKMYAETSVRDGFVIRSQSYYECVWRTFIEKGMARPLIAEAAGQPVASLILFLFAGRAWYLYGMSTGAHRELMPNYLLQFEAMRAAREAGCSEYDLWGAPDQFDESDSMWGVYRFKEGLGGEVIRTPGAWDYPASPLFYRLYTQTLPRILSIMRRRRKAETRQEVAI